MIKNNILIFSFLLIFLGACNGTKKSSVSKFSIVTANKKSKFKYGETVSVSIQNPKSVVIDSVVFSINNKSLSYKNNQIQLEGVKLGHQVLKATVYHNGTSEVTTKKITVLANKAPVIYTYTIVNEYPHDMNAYTQGLEFYNDTLYESTGRNGFSSLRKVDYKTGKVLKKIDLDRAYFGEGITILNNKIYQLTWLKKIGFIYDVSTFKQIDTFNYNKSKEGWGLCNDGKVLYKSDGTEKIWILNPETLKEEDYIQTVTNTSVFNRANELEYVNGKIYANVYQKESMMIIDAKTGAIEGVVNFSGLRKKVTQHANLDVLNGVAYNSKTNTFFVTGKNWDKLFEVTIVPKQ